MRRGTRRLGIGGRSLLMWLLLVAVCEACPTCKDSLAQGPHANLVRGYFFSILLMMSMPFVILSGLVAYGYFLVRRARNQQPSQPPSQSVRRPSDQTVGQHA